MISPDIPVEEVERALEAIRDAYDLGWLEATTEPHPMRGLWGRTDFIATQELLLLGSSIIEIGKVDARWLKDAVKKAKAFDESRVGFVFEIVMVAALLRGGHALIPAKPSMPVYDLDVALANGDTARISLKHHGATSKEKQFRKNAKLLLKQLKTTLAGTTQRWHGVLAITELYPRDADWTELALALVARVNDPHDFKVGKWHVRYEQAAFPESSLADSRRSYSLKIVAPHHPYEAKAFTDSLERGSAALNRAAAAWPPNVRAILMVRLSESAELQTHVEWATEYLNRADTSVAGICILQSTIAQSTAERSTSIINTVQFVCRNGLPAPALQMALTSGLGARTQIPYMMIVNGEQTPVHGVHVFHDSEVFTLAEFDPTGTTISNMDFSPGRTVHGGFRMGGEELILSPKFKIPDQLTLFT
jgi:hypothetical protein